MQFKKLTTDKEVLDLIEYHNTESKYVVLDLETTGLNPFKDTIIAAILNDRGNTACYIVSDFIQHLSKIRKPILCHNFKFDFNFLYRAGIDLRRPGLFADTLLLDHLLDENNKGEHGLDAIVQRRYGDNYKDVFWSKYKTFQDAPEEDQIAYACKDVIYTKKIYEDISDELKQDGIPDSLLDHVHKFALSLYAIEIEGLNIDLPYLEKMGTTLTTEITKTRQLVREFAELEVLMIENDLYGKELDKRKTDKGKQGVKRPQFNLDSSSHLQSLLYEQLKIPPQFNPKTKARTCDDDALEKIETMHEIIPRIREYRGHQKVFTAFIEGTLEKMVKGRIYPSFNINGTVTGRISSSNPNMQQLPKDGGVRGIYTADSGHVLISCDYAQLEVTIAAHYSRDANLLKIVYDGASQHDITAEGLGIPRNTAKTINFALQYGAGAHKIQKILGCTFKEAEKTLAKYWETYSGLRDFIASCHAKVEKGEPLVNPFGRKRRFPIGLESWDLDRAKRQAANSIIQGTGADLTHQAFYEVDRALRSMGIGKALFPVHDEILIQVVNNDTSCKQAQDVLRSIMVNVGKQHKLTVPLTASCGEPMERWKK